jgi:lycopene beta-cyclase
MTSITNRLPFLLHRKHSLAYTLLGLWLLTMIALPIFWWTWGDSILPMGITVAAIFQASAVFIIVQNQWGLAKTLKIFAIIALFSWGAEYIGSTTGIPFGSYEYTEVLQPQLLGVPMLIPVAWFMLLPSAWVIAQLIVGEGESLKKKAAFVGMSALALTAWDLFLDPQMVGWGFWRWETPSGYFGIPYENYLGWLVVATLITAIANPPKLKTWPLALVYGVVWFLQGFGQAFFFDQLGPAIVGSLAMGGIMLLAWWGRRKRGL